MAWHKAVRKLLCIPARAHCNLLSAILGCNNVENLNCRCALLKFLDSAIITKNKCIGIHANQQYTFVWNSTPPSPPPSNRKPLLPNNSVLIGEVLFGQRQHCMHSQYLLQEFLSFLEGRPLQRVSFRETAVVA